VNKQPSLGNVPATDDHNALSDSDLFQMLLGEEAKKAIDQTPPNQPEPSNESNLKPYTPSKKEKPNPHPYLQQTTSRLDFRPINDPVSDSQLKVMTSKERRQLRNKISARNFRNRRKGK
jgi:hypothetical protein